MQRTITNMHGPHLPQACLPVCILTHLLLTRTLSESGSHAPHVEKMHGPAYLDADSHGACRDLHVRIFPRKYVLYLTHTISRLWGLGSFSTNVSLHQRVNRAWRSAGIGYWPISAQRLGRAHRSSFSMPLLGGCTCPAPIIRV